MKLASSVIIQMRGILSGTVLAGSAKIVLCHRGDLFSQSYSCELPLLVRSETMNSVSEPSSRQSLYYRIG